MPELSPAETTAAWRQQLEQVRQAMRAGGAGAGIARPEQIAHLNGMQIFEAMLAGLLPYPNICDTLDFSLVEVSPGQAVFQGQPQLMHYNPLGTVHGGWYATLLDSALGCAVHTLLPAERVYTTAELSVNLVKAASPQAGPLRAIGTVLHCGRQLATAEARLVGPDGKLYAHATTTCLVFDLPLAKASAVA